MVPGVGFSCRIQQMESIKQPNPLILTGNIADNWKKFKQELNLYMVATGLDKKNDQQKIALLLHIAQSAAIELYNTFTFPNDEEGNSTETYDAVVKKFEGYCNPKRNTTYERHIFFSTSQAEGESIEAYVTNLKTKAQTCGFEHLRDGLIRDRLILGIQNNRLRERLLREEDLSLEKAVQLCKAAECAERQVSVMQDSAAAASVMTIQHKQGQRRERNRRNCGYCGEIHERRKCPAYGKTCSKCGRRNHISTVCRSREQVREVKLINDNKEHFQEEEFFCGAIYNVNQIDRDNKWIQEIEVNGTPIRFQLDTGSEVSIVTASAIKALNPVPTIKKSDITMKTYSGNVIASAGMCTVQLSYKDNVARSNVQIVADETRSCILGANDCERLKLVQRVNNITCEIKAELYKQYKDLFTGTGTLPDVHSFKLKDNHLPVIHAPRRVAASRRDRLKAELDRQVELGYISKVNEPTEWVNSLVIREKSSGALRLCIDPKDLNDAILREHYQMPTKEEILMELAGAVIFSKMDATSGFHQIQLDEASSKMTTFNTPFGRYRYLRLPMGITSAPEVFHKTMVQHLDDIEGVRVYIDDIIVWGTSQEEHDRRLKKVLCRLKEINLKLNISKCEFSKPCLKYLGEIITSTGVKPDPEKLEAIKELPRPNDAQAVSRFLGMVTYIGRFIPDLSNKTEPLRRLLSKGATFSWTQEQEQAWQTLKADMTTTPVLQYYDPRKKLKIACDASKTGLGAVLLQCTSENNWLPIAYASRSMSKAERNYATIEKELLAIVWSCERFHAYIYGYAIIIESDHKPLISIRKKPLCNAPARLQKLFLMIQKYDFELVHVPGVKQHLADALSRDHLAISDNTTENDVEVHVCSIKYNIPVSTEKWKAIAEATNKDAKLQQVIASLYDNTLVCPAPYSGFKEELNVIDGVLLKQQAVVIPQVLRTEMLQLIHEGHLGIVKSKQRVRGILYWPEMNKQIYDAVSSCETCLQHRYSQSDQPILYHERPLRPWMKLGCDIFYFNREAYLLVVDYVSHYPEVAKLHGEATSAVVTKLKSILSRHGIPHTLMTDNGPQFASAEFKIFAKQWGFNHVTSSPYHARSNGLVENCVKIIKRTLIKTYEAKEDPYLAMLAYRDAPLGCGKSPAELLFNRKLKTRVPSSQTWCESFNQKADTPAGKDLPELHKGDVVRVKQHSTMNKGPRWPQRGIVIGQANRPRSYIVETEEGQRIERNRQHLLASKEQYSHSPCPDIDELVTETKIEGSSPVKMPIPTDNDNMSGSQKGNIDNQSLVPTRRYPQRDRQKPDRLTYY